MMISFRQLPDIVNGVLGSLLLAALLLGASLPVLAGFPDDSTETITLTELERVKFSSQSPPATELLDDAGIYWESVDLPLIENPAYYTTMDEFEITWFRLPVAELTLHDWLQPAIYVWRHNVRIGLYLDDRYIGGTLRHSNPERLSISWNHPVLVDLPINRFGGADSYVYLRVDAGPGGTVLAPLMFGEKPELQPLFDDRNFLQVEAAFWVFLLCCALSALALWLWTQRRQDRLYIEFSLLSALSALTTSFFFLDFVPFSMRIWLTLQHTASAWILLLVIRFATDALNISWDKRIKYLQVTLIIATIAYPLLPDYYFQITAYMVTGLLTLIGMALGAQILYITAKEPNGNRLWFSVAFIGMYILQMHDMHAAFFTPDEEHIYASNWMQLSSPMLALAFFAHLIHRFTDALDASEALNRNLEARVAETRQELQSSYDKNREFELESHANEERQRIYRELHDDLGSKLISIVHTAADDTQQTLARGALESLRESIYKASNPSQTLGVCIEQIREEAELRLTSAGKGFSSHIDVAGGASNQIDPSTAYNLKRIFREGVSNILQHASCDKVELIVRQVNDQIELQLEDDGVGQVRENSASNGLANIRFRAKQMGAEVAWQDLIRGNRLALTFPFMHTR